MSNISEDNDKIDVEPTQEGDTIYYSPQSNFDKKNNNKKNSDLEAGVGCVVIVFFIIICVLFVSCINSCFSTESIDKEAFTNFRDLTYEQFSTIVYDKITGNKYYLDVVDYCDQFEDAMNELVKKYDGWEFKITEVNNDVYSTGWVASIVYNKTVYPMFVLSVTFTTSYRCSTKSLEKIPVK